ncbi:MAG: MFS transporter [Anaerolineae bacterium]
MSQATEATTWPGRLRGFAASMGKPIAVLLLLQLLAGVALSPQRTFFPLYLKDLGHPVLLISGLATAQQVMGLVGSWVGGALSDTWGRKVSLLIGQAGALFAGLAFIWPSAGWIAVFWTLSGLCGGVQTVGAQSYLVDAAQPGSLGVMSALFNWGYTLGGAAGSPFGGLLLEYGSYRLFGVALVALGLVILTVNALALPPLRAATRSVRRGLFGYGDLALRRPVILLTLLRFLPTCYWGMALILIPLQLDELGASRTAIAMYAMVSQILAAAAQFTVGRAADRLHPGRPTVITLTALVVATVCGGLFIARLWAVFVFGALGTMAAWSLSVLLPTLAAQTAEPEERGRVLGWVHLWWNAGMIAGSLLGGALYTAHHGLPFLLAGLLNVAAIGVALVFVRTVENGRASPLARRS